MTSYRPAKLHQNPVDKCICLLLIPPHCVVSFAVSRTWEASSHTSIECRTCCCRSSAPAAPPAWAEEPKQHTASDRAVTRNELVPEVIPLLLMRRPSRHTRSAMLFPSFCTKTKLLQMQLQCLTAPANQPRLTSWQPFQGMVATMELRA